MHNSRITTKELEKRQQEFQYALEVNERGLNAYQVKKSGDAPRKLSAKRQRILSMMPPINQKHHVGVRKATPEQRVVQANSASKLFNVTQNITSGPFPNIRATITPTVPADINMIVSPSNKVRANPLQLSGCRINQINMTLSNLNETQQQNNQQRVLLNQNTFQCGGRRYSGRNQESNPDIDSFLAFKRDQQLNMQTRAVKQEYTPTIQGSLRMQSVGGNQDKVTPHSAFVVRNKIAPLRGSQSKPPRPQNSAAPEKSKSKLRQKSSSISVDQQTARTSSGQVSTSNPQRSLDQRSLFSTISQRVSNQSTGGPRSDIDSENEVRAENTPKLNQNKTAAGKKKEQQIKLEKMVETAAKEEVKKAPKVYDPLDEQSLVAIHKHLSENSHHIFKKIPKVSAKCWAIFEGSKQQYIFGKSENQKREVASLTKMMTAYVVIQVAIRYKLDLSEIPVSICNLAANIRGTSATLREGDVLTAEQLLYGLMLPSGNDAAFALAKHFGQFIFKKKRYAKDELESIKSFQFNNHSWYVKYFLHEMNEQAMRLKMTQTHFDSPHGLMNVQNVSTAHDMAKLAAKCMTYPFFKKITSTKEYTCRPKLRASDAEHDFEYTWVNTNKLLNKSGFTGCKTGITEAAGPCLAASFKKDQMNYVVVILQSKSMEARWEEVPKLIQWAIMKKVFVNNKGFQHYRKLSHDLKALLN